MAAAYLLPSPRLPVLLLLFVFLAVHAPSSAHGDPLPSTYPVSMCSSESFQCGDVEIRYPFYLANATQATADYSGNYSCGYTDLNISCTPKEQTLTPTIRLGGDEYTVKNISYGYYDHTISLADSDVLLQLLVGDCPIVHHNVSFDEVWLYNTSTFDNITFFFGCHWGPSNTPPRFADYQIRCAGGGSFVFRPEDIDEQEERELASNCDEVFSVPVTSQGLLATNVINLTRDGYGKLLRQGFELAWKMASGDQNCDLCERSGSGGRCSYSQKREFLGCLCDGGEVGNPYCKLESKRRTTIIAG